MLNLLFSDLNRQQSLKLTHHRMVGAGLPFARHLNVTLAPSLTTTSVDVWASSIFGGTLFVHCVVDENDDIFFSSSVNYRLTFIHENKKKGNEEREGKKLFICSPTTCKYPNWVLAVTVFIWHMYLPLSSSCTLAMCKNQVLCLSCLSCVTEIRGFLVITWLCTVNIADCSKCIQATCNNPNENWRFSLMQFSLVKRNPLSCMR